MAIGPPIRVFKYVEALEDWAPCYRIRGPYRGEQDPSLIEVSLQEVNEHWQVHASGADDFAMTILFVYKENAIEEFVDVIARPALTREWLAKRGWEVV